MSEVSCYGRLHTTIILVIAWVTDAIVPYIPMGIFSKLVQFSVSSTFNAARWISKFQDRPLPPNFNTDFKEPLADVKPEQLKWLAEFPERQESDPIILYLHGGGYGWSLQIPQVLAMRDIYLAVGNPRLSILVLDYTTSVNACFPKQLQETAEVYNALARSCKNIILFGDSAGGHLSLHIMRHIVSPEKGVPLVTQKPLAFVGISPAVDMALDLGTNSHRNTQHDILSIHMMQGWSKMFAGNEELTQSPAVRLTLDRDIDWNVALPPPSRVFIAYGGREVLIDSIETFIADNDLKQKGAIIFAHPLDVHDSLMMLGSPSPMMKPTVEFLKSLSS